MIRGISAVRPYFSRFQLFHHLISHLNPYPAATPWIIFYHPRIFHGIGEGGRRYKGVVEANYLWFASSLLLKSGPRLDYKCINVKSLYLWKGNYCSNYRGVKYKNKSDHVLCILDPIWFYVTEWRVYTAICEFICCSFKRKVILDDLIVFSVILIVDRWVCFCEQ